MFGVFDSVAARGGRDEIVVDANDAYEHVKN
jgi:hypothetical protein